VDLVPGACSGTVFYPPLSTFYNGLRLVPRRFRRWVLALGELRTSATAVDNPPLDVWLIWHAYMLNPTYG